MTWTAHGSSTGTCALAERSLIDSIAAALAAAAPAPGARVVRGTGDDAAVVRARALS